MIIPGGKSGPRKKIWETGLLAADHAEAIYETACLVAPGVEFLLDGGTVRSQGGVSVALIERLNAYVAGSILGMRIQTNRKLPSIAAND